ncbi:hypothetical protein SG34_030135 [Thalassomonas viridans]|uniref:Uncharacterized protein n=1 Tax=Thalassomonas viridans TaxID=137584 RepID=A0AAE9ZED2_9GAMM|nr:hypothetical protein [Thalassomonas viridans]WDE09038.1 hypothetical protein SG34_030135 [Thalassomonas viridans]
MSNQSQYEKMIETMYARAYKRIDQNYVESLDALNIPHVFGNLIADLPGYAHGGVISHVIKSSLRNLSKYQLAKIFLMPARAAGTKTQAGATAEEEAGHEFLIVTKQALPDALTDREHLLNEWRKEGKHLTSNFNVTFTDETDYLARKEFCTGGKCHAEQNTGIRCKDDLCICLPSLACNRGFELLFIDTGN